MEPLDLKKCANCKDWVLIGDLVVVVNDGDMALICVDCIVELRDPVGEAERVLAEG